MYFKTPSTIDMREKGSTLTLDPSCESPPEESRATSEVKVSTRTHTYIHIHTPYTRLILFIIILHVSIVYHKSCTYEQVIG